MSSLFSQQFATVASSGARSRSSVFLPQEQIATVCSSFFNQDTILHSLADHMEGTSSSNDDYDFACIGAWVTHESAWNEDEQDTQAHSDNQASLQPAHTHSPLISAEVNQSALSRSPHTRTGSADHPSAAEHSEMPAIANKVDSRKDSVVNPAENTSKPASG